MGTKKKEKLKSWAIRSQATLNFRISSGGRRRPGTRTSPLADPPRLTVERCINCVWSWFPPQLGATRWCLQLPGPCLPPQATAPGSSTRPDPARQRVDVCRRHTPPVPPGSPYLSPSHPRDNLPRPDASHNQPVIRRQRTPDRVARRRQGPNGDAPRNMSSLRQLLPAAPLGTDGDSSSSTAPSSSSGSSRKPPRKNRADIACTPCRKRRSKVCGVWCYDPISSSCC